MLRSTRFVATLVVSLFLAACDGGGGGGPNDPPDDGLPDLGRSQSIEGTFTFDQVTIPAGVTITATGTLVLNSTGPVRINGTLTGDCVAITVNGSGALTVTGRVANGCATPPAAADAPALTLVGNGDVAFDGAEISTSGDLTVKNDPTLTDANFPGAVAPAGGLAPAQVRVFDIRNSSEFDSPGPARSGDDGDDDETGANGRRGGRWSFFARGDLTVDDSSIDGQDGGDGGDHVRSGSGNTTAEGGNGADGGDVRLLATGRAVLQNGSSVKSGDGGDGGAATATSTNGDGARAGSATAEGGDGAEAGLLRVEGQGGISIGAAVTIEIGASGDGGDGTANGADGSICVDGHGQHGGNATATGGQGSDSPEGRLRIIGNVVGQPAVTGADAGDGGAATANAGNGKAGENCDDCKDGGDGGSMSATGGDGGDALIRNAQGTPVGQAGDGGAARISKGNGAEGFDCCDPPEAGGAGGDGGDGTAEDGEAGAGGAQPGQAGGVTVEGAGNGAMGGDGMPVGSGGDGGDEAIENHGDRTDVGDSFMDAPDGNPCPAAAKFDVDPRSAQQSGGVVQPGTQTLALVDQSGQAVGQIVAVFAGQVFVGSSPPRFGLAPGGSMELRLDQATVGGADFLVDEGKEQVEVCGVNNSTTQTLNVERRDSGGSLLSAESIKFRNECIRRFYGSGRVKLQLDPNSPAVMDIIASIISRSTDS